MKRTVLSLLCFLTVAAYAQDGFFLQPVVGAGLSNVRTKTAFSSGDIKSVLGIDARIDVGFTTNRWVLSSGVGYLRTGSRAEIVFLNALGDPIGTGYVYEYYNHIIVPLSVGYEVVHGKKFKLRPNIGADLSYTISARETTANTLYTKKTEPMPAEQFKKQFNQLGAFGLLQINMDYAISKKVSINMAPTMDYMITNMLKKANGAPGNPSQRPYTLLLNAGVKLHL